MQLHFHLSRFKELRFLLVTLSFFTLLVSSNHLQCLTFIDVDEFEFQESGIISGLRICAFDSETQKYKSIDYYQLPATNLRKPTGVFLNNFYKLEIHYNGDVNILSPLRDTMVRTHGQLLGNLKSLQTFKDDQTKNVAYSSLDIVTALNLSKKLNTFNKGTYGKSSIQIPFHHNYPNWKQELRSFNNICQDETEKRKERGIIGELATRIAFFSSGYLEKIPTQDNSGQGIDGIYIQRNEAGQPASMFLTESKCHAGGSSTSKVMESQLTEKILFGNISRLENTQRTMILNFIDQDPTAVFKAAHRTLINGSSEWLVKPLEINAFQVLRTGITSPEKEKEVFITTISRNFSSPEEMIRVALAHYHIESDQEKVACFNKVLGCSTEQFEQLVTTYKQESKELKVRKRLSYGLPSAEQSKFPAEQLTTTQHSTCELKNISAIEYSRENLAKLLTFFKGRDEFKRGHCKIINEGLQRISSKNSVESSELSQLSNYNKYPTFHKKISHKSLWDDLLKAFSTLYQQALVEKIFEEEI